MTETLPAPSSDRVAGIVVEWLFQSPAIGIHEWTCEASTPDVTAERSQPWHVIGFVHEGGYELRDRRGTSFHDPARVSFFNAGAPYHTRHPVGLGDRGSSVIVAPEVLLEIIALYDPSVASRPESPFRIAQAAIAGPTLLLHHILMRKLRSSADPLMLEEASLELVYCVIREIHSSTAASRSLSVRAPERQRVVDAARAFLAADFAATRRLSSVAQAAGVSAFHLCRIFKAEMGCSVHAYLNRLRLRAALERLPRRSGDLSSLALEVGFSSHSHFTDAFRREFGVAPSEVERLDRMAPAALPAHENL